jgi:hypothetical protein
MIRLAIVDDHQVVINGLKSMLAADPALQVDLQRKVAKNC